MGHMREGIFHDIPRLRSSRPCNCFSFVSKLSKLLHIENSSWPCTCRGSRQGTSSAKKVGLASWPMVPARLKPSSWRPGQRFPRRRKRGEVDWPSAIRACGATCTVKINPTKDVLSELLHFDPARVRPHGLCWKIYGLCMACISWMRCCQKYLLPAPSRRHVAWLDI